LDGRRLEKRTLRFSRAAHSQRQRQRRYREFFHGFLAPRVAAAPRARLGLLSHVLGLTFIGFPALTD
jgi:hypothetical protein